jgi:hypothetical protein
LGAFATRKQDGTKSSGSKVGALCETTSVGSVEDARSLVDRFVEVSVKRGKT